MILKKLFFMACFLLYKLQLKYFMKFKWEMIMTTKKTLSPLAMGALTLTLGMSLVNNANASLIAGETDGATTFATNVVVDANAEENRFYFGEDIFFIEDVLLIGEDFNGEDSARLELNVGDGNTSIFVNDFIQSFSFGEEVSRLGSLNSNDSELLFSVNSCGFTDCLNQFTAGDVIDESWFDGTFGDASDFGVLYEEGFDVEIDSDDFPDFGDLGNWGEVGDTGFVAFAYNLESVDVQFGFLEITRGSISVNQAVIQNVTTSVPEPASLLLLGAGLLGLASRKKLKA